MKLLNIRGRLVDKSVAKYRIDWDKPSRSKLQFNAKQLLRQIWSTQIIYEEFPCFGSLLKVDIFNATKKIVVEINGSQHESYNKFFHNNSRMNYLASIKRDYQKRQWLELNGIRLVEVIKEDVDNPKRFFELVGS